MRELIEREAVFNAIQSVHIDSPALDNAIAEIPEVEIEEVLTGIWLDKGEGNPDGRFLCNRCLGYSDHDSTYCPNCGSRMKSEEEIYAE